MSLNKKNKELSFDIVVVGAGPIGLAFACGFAKTNIKVAIIDKLPKKNISTPKIDGREIALTHHSVKILEKLEVWKYISKKLISPIKEARVLDGDFKYFLNFAHEEIKKDCLGYIVPNCVIRKALYQRLKKIKNVSLLNNSECLLVNTNEKFASLDMADGKKIKTLLVVAADSRFSKMRKKMGISAFTRNFKKNMIVCRMKHEKHHENIAYEFFRYNQTQASLPYVNNQSGIVTTADNDLTSKLMNMNAKDFSREIENNFGRSLGKMQLIGKRYTYPMITTYTKKFVSNRFAVIGDAAVGMHPVTAHGFNLGLKGLDILIDENKKALKNKNDIGMIEVLSKYQSKLHRAAAPVYLATNSIINLYTSNFLPAKITRQFLLRFVNTINPVKQTFLNILK